MSTSVPPRDGEGGISPAPHLLLADEEALRRVFTGEFPVLVADARAHLGDGVSLAPRVVEGAFVRAWHERARFHTQEELHGFLVEDIQHRAARALSRRAAAHRVGQHGHDYAHHDPHDAAVAAHTAAAPPEQLDPEASWAHVTRAIHGETHSASALAAAADVSRHEAAEHVKAIANQGNWKMPALIGAIAVALAIGAVLYIDRLGEGAAANRAVNAADARSVPTNPGQMAVVTLDDGTRARLAPESKLSIPKEFGPKLRAVKIDGAATFEVAPGQSQAFRVFARNASVTATGTAFTVRAYEPDDVVSVTVREGSVSVEANDETHTASAGQTVVVPRSGAPREATAAEREEATAWLGNRFVVSARPLRDVLPQLRTWYDIDVKVPDLKLLDRPVTVRASMDSVSRAIADIERSANVKFGYQGKMMVFEDAAKKK